MYILQEKLFDIPTINLVQKEVYSILSSIVDKNGNINKKTVEKYCIPYSEEKILKTIHSSKLKKLSNDLFIANKEKPIKINITLSANTNTYFPTKKEIRISIPLPAIYALNTYIKNGCSNIFEVNKFHFRNSREWKKGITQFKDFVNEYENAIIHEVSHWVDDALHNSFFEKLKVFADQIRLSKEEFDLLYANTPMDSMFFEINAQVHVIENLRKKNIGKWDSITMEDVILSHSGLRAVFFSLYKSGFFLVNQWIQILLKRLSREGLLSASMQTLNQYEIQRMLKYITIKEERIIIV